MEDILSIAVLFSVGFCCFLWGAVLGLRFLEFRIDRGKLPQALSRKREKLLALLSATEGGDANPQAPGSGPGLELKAKKSLKKEGVPNG